MSNTNSCCACSVDADLDIKNLSFYAEDVFGPEMMRQYLAKATAEKLISTINDGAPLDPAIAGDVAHAMKRWALDRGATHFTHWFQPLTGGTAEKHDAFLEPVDNNKALHVFSGKNLIVGEPDASSFPSGGLRCTFEARGYTAWDPTSPAFIKRHDNGATLCIPTAFCSYTGEVLDKKTPLLRSIQSLKKSVIRLMNCFDLPESPFTVTLGAEQEYFLIDKKFYLERPDLIQTGRTLFGAAPAKHQQLEDHYFGSIRTRVLNFMNEVEHTLWKLGIPAKTRHNEVAPAQFELAPMFENANLAVDHNMIVMEVLRTVADKHGMVCLLHEKPFAGVNGSGKHHNWSMNYGTLNLLNPGNDPHQNAIFLTVLTSIIKAIDEHSDILRSAVATAGNDHRLGANEAPPAIISMFLGDQLNDIIEQLEKGPATRSRRPSSMRIGVDTLPALPQDATDRNRTSPFAFTGNKFEFRAPGSSQSCAGSLTALNTIVAESMNELAEKIEAFDPKKFNESLQALLGKEIKAHKRVIFNGDNYSAEWRAEAKKRGLLNKENTPSALSILNSEKNIELFSKHGVFNSKELHSRTEVFVEGYERRVRIEGEVALEMAKTMISPAVKSAFSECVTPLIQAQELGLRGGIASLKADAETLGTALDKLTKACIKLEKALADDHEEILPALTEMRTIVDAVEGIVPDNLWPLPKYRDMLFIY